MAVNLGLATLGLACLINLVIVVVHQPIAAAGPLVLTAVVAYRMRRRLSTSEEQFFTTAILAGIAGGILSQSLNYVVGGIPEDAPSPLWLLLGAIGLGGAYGLLVSLLALTVILTLPVYRLIFRRFHAV